MQATLIIRPAIQNMQPPHQIFSALTATIFTLPLIFSITACTSNAWRSDLGADWQEHIEAGTSFQHRIIFKAGRGDVLHIYFDGDGDIWRTATELNFDPTPQHSLALQLMQRDPAPALLIGRPCYLQVHDAHCSAYWWTAARYSQPIIESMRAVAQHWSAQYREVTLIGYSGGGALAVLIAPQLPQVRTVITLAANLDTESWGPYHHYSDEVAGASLNPIVQPALPPYIAQWHYAGSNDRNVLAQWIENFSARQPNAHFVQLEQVDHYCCWVQQWPALLQRIEQNSAD